MIPSRHLMRMVNLVADSLLCRPDEKKVAFFDIRVGVWKRRDSKEGCVRYVRLGFYREGSSLLIFWSESETWTKAREAKEKFYKIGDVLYGTDYSGMLHGRLKKLSLDLMRRVDPALKRSDFEVKIDPQLFEFPYVLFLPAKALLLGTSDEVMVLQAKAAAS